MDNKRFLVIILAIILALIVAFCFANKNKTSIINETCQEEITENVNDAKIDESENNKTKSPVIETNKPTAEKTVENPTQKLSTQQTKTLKTEIEKVENTNPTQDKSDAGIIKDSTTNEIVITREFKMESPAKYSFK